MFWCDTHVHTYVHTRRDTETSRFVCLRFEISCIYKKNKTETKYVLRLNLLEVCVIFRMRFRGTIKFKVIIIAVLHNGLI